MTQRDNNEDDGKRGERAPTSTKTGLGHGSPNSDPDTSDHELPMGAAKATGKAPGKAKGAEFLTASLRKAYQDTVEEDLPDAFRDLLNKLD